MIQGKSVIAIIPARSGSKRLPKKNILPLSGKPLIAWTIQAALSSNYIDKCIVSTDCDEIANLAKEYGASVPFMRPSKLATDQTSSSSVYLHVLETLQEDYDIAIFLQPTSPLRLASDIDQSLEIMLSSESPSIVSVGKSKHPANWHISLDSNQKIKSTLDKVLDQYNGITNDHIYYFNGAIKAINVEHYIKERTFFSDNTVVYVMPQKRSIDIDTDIDFKLAELLIDKSNY